MQIKYIKLENIRSYINQKIEFPSGNLLLSGDIGSGKSTILLAIEFALFGSNKSDLPGHLLLRNGKTTGSVELCFQIKEDEYIIKRALKKNKDSVSQDTGFLIKNKKKFEGTATELKAKIIEILGYPEDLIAKSKANIYRYTVYCPQEEMKKIIYENSEIRLDTLRKLFGIEKYKTIRENADFYARELRKKIAELNIRLENYNELEKQTQEQKQIIEKLENKLKAEISELNNIRENIKIEKSNYDMLEKKIKKLDETKKEVIINENQIKSKKQLIESLNKNKTNIKNKIVLYEKRLIDYKNIDKIKPEKEIENELNKLIEELNQYIKEKASLEQKVSHCDEQIKKIESEIIEINEKTKKHLVLEKEISAIEEKLSQKKYQEKLHDETIEKLNSIKIKIEKIDFSISQSKKIIGNIKEADVCVLCLQKVDEKHKKEVIEKEEEKIKKEELEKKKYQEFEKKALENLNIIKNNLEKLEKWETIFKEKSKEIAILKEHAKNSLIKQKELSEIQLKKQEVIEKLKLKEKNIIKEEIESKKKVLSEIRDYNMKCREKRNILENINNEKENIEKIDKEIEDIIKEIKIIENRIIELNKEIEINKNSEKDFLEQKKSYESLKEIEKKKEIEITSLSKEKTILSGQVKEYEKKLEALEILKKKNSELKKTEEFISDFFIKLMITMEKHIMVSIHREFESLLKEWFSMLIEGIDILLEDDFSVKVIQDGYETTIDNLSGGEKTAVALSYRLALNKVINDIITNIKTKDFIILDEPTDGFSSEQLDKVRDVLEQLNMKQTIIVSHEQKMESYVDNVIRVAKNNNVSNVFV